MESLLDNQMLEKQEKSPLPKVPLFATIEREAIKNNPDHEAALKRTFDIMNRQFFENYGVFSSEDQKGVSFAYTTLVIDKQVIEQIGDLPHAVNLSPQLNKNEECFIEPAFALPMEGDPSHSADEAAYLYLQKLTTVAKAMERGEEPGYVKIHIFGQPEGLGGSVNSGFLKSMLTSRFNQHGKAYAELVGKILAGVDLAKTKIRFQGASKGSVTVDKTSKHLPDKLKTKTVEGPKGQVQEVDAVQRFYDNPAGIHGGNPIERAVKGLNLLGILVDIGTVSLKDPLVKGIGNVKKDYNRYLSETMNLPKGGKKQQALKWLTFIAECIPLAVGNTPEESAVAVTSRLDPTNIKRRVFGKLRGRTEKDRRERPMLMYNDRQTHIAPIKTEAGHAYNTIHKMLEPGRIGKRLDVILNLRQKGYPPKTASVK